MSWEEIKQRAARDIHCELGEEVTYHYQEGHSRKLIGVFVIKDVQVDLGGEVKIDSRAPACGFRRCVLERKPRQGDLITRRNVTYEIKEVQEKGDASFECLLLEVDTRHHFAIRDRT